MNQLESLATLLGQRLQQRGDVVTVAESCTGGMIATALTSVIGSSSWFGYGFIPYSNAAKNRLLGVDSQTLITFGAVSDVTVSEMAMGALRVSGADWAVSVSGIAGPDGGSQEKPVGTVWFAIASRYDHVTTFSYRFLGARNEIRTNAAAMALQQLIDRVSARPVSKS